jgi:hypothetical protein
MYPKERVELQFVDYAVTHVGKKYPSPWLPTVYRPPETGHDSPSAEVVTTNGEYQYICR